MLGFLDYLNDIGSNIRYGVSPEEKYRMLVNQEVPGMPAPFTSSGEENPAATRFLSNYLGAQQWGQTLPRAFNTVRYLIDKNPDVFAQGLKGMEAAKTAPGLGFLSFFGD